MVRLEDFLKETHGFYFPHRHNYYMIMVATGGKGQHLIDFKSYAVQANRVFLMYPGMIHAWEEARDLNGYLIFFTDHFFAQRYHFDSLLSFPFFNTSRGLPFVDLNQEQLQSLLPVLEVMLEEYEMRGEKMAKAIRSLLNVALIKAARAYQGDNYLDTEDKTRSELVRKFEQLVNQHYLEKRLVKDYAKLLHISPNYLNVVVKEVTGKSAGEIIRDRVMLEAKRKLTHEKKTVAEIGFDLNFKDTAYFCRFFRKYEGASPDKFRKNIFN
jgi:AraC family transcriptional activator of pobA